jgi:hypothetical protein
MVIDGGWPVGFCAGAVDVVVLSALGGGAFLVASFFLAAGLAGIGMVMPGMSMDCAKAGAEGAAMTAAEQRMKWTKVTQSLSKLRSHP